MEKKDLPPEKVYTDENPKPTKNTLAQLVQYACALESAIAISAENNLGEVDLELEGKLIELHEKQLPDKVGAYSFVIKHMKKNKEFWEEKIDEAKKVINTIENREKKMKDFIKDEMLKMGVDELPGWETKFQLRKTQGSLVIDNKDLVPGGHREIIPATFTLNAKSIRSDIEAGFEVPGAHIEPGLALYILPNVSGKKTKGIKNVEPIEPAKSIESTDTKES